MTTRYTEENRVAGWQYCADLDAREALQRIEADKLANHTRRRFRHESPIAWRVRVGLAVVGKVRGLSPADKLRAGFAAFWLLLASIFIASLTF